ncbi:MAG: vWA domain-containing protein [Mycobacteriales bacterium]
MLAVGDHEDMTGAAPLSVQELLLSLELGQPNEEFALGDALRAFYELDDGADLSVELAECSVQEVLAVLLTAAEPFAALVVGVFDFIGRLNAKVEGNFEALIAADRADALGLDLSRFNRYEREICEQASRKVDLETLLAGSGSAWRSFHDWYFPPHCVWRVDRPPDLSMCEGCPSAERVSEFRFVETTFGDLAEQAGAAAGPSGDDELSWLRERIVRVWPELRARSHGDRCPRADGWGQQVWSESIEELREARLDGEFEQLQRLLALPYWQHRWQLYEVWLLGIVLDVVGLDRIQLVLDDGIWRLPVGGVAASPVALIRGPIEAEVLYQHQGTPPRPLFADQEDRPEILIRTTGRARERVVLAAEAKARRSLTRGDVQGFTYPLLMWQPAIALFAGYFPINKVPPVSLAASGDSDLVVAVDCRPDTGVEAELRGQLGPLLARELAPPLQVFVYDVSGSMSESLAISDVPQDATTVLIAFAERAALVPSGAVSDARSLSLGTGTNLSAVVDILPTMLEQWSTSNGGEIHLVTDLEVDTGELASLMHLGTRLGLGLTVHTTDRDRAQGVIRAIPELRGRIAFLS